MSLTKQAEIDLFERRRKGLPIPRIQPGYQYFPNGAKRRATRIQVPSTFSVEANRDEVLGFVYAYRSAVFVRPPLGQKYRWIMVDLSGVTTMALDAALLVTAEFHRNLLLKPGSRPAIDDAGWPIAVRGLLNMLGFYDLVDAQSRTGAAELLGSDIKFVKFVSAEIADGEFADNLIENLRAAGGVAPDREALYAALVEAILNVTQHAYPPDEHPEVFKRARRWWAAGALDEKRQTLEFVVFDQGVGIPATLPRRSFFESVLTLCAPERTDADLIEGGIEFGRTRTEQPERGNGLWTICSMVDGLGSSYVQILSGRGELTYSSDGGTKKRNHSNAFCGTMIKWTLSLPAAAPTATAR